MRHGPQRFRQTPAKSRKLSRDPEKTVSAGLPQGQEEFPRLIRIAVYDSLREVPRLQDIRGGDVRTVIEEAAAQAYQGIREMGGRISLVALREAVENLVHADLQGATVSILDEGRTVIISDRGPGIAQKERAMLPGFSTASERLRRFIRGVGSGLAVAQETMGAEDGFVALENNLEGGTVVTLSTLRHRREEIVAREGVIGPGARTGFAEAAGADRAQRRSVTGRPPAGTELLRLGAIGPGLVSHRQQQILAFLAAMAQVGPTAVAREMGLSLATAHRELARLEEMGLVLSLGRGKRALTREGIDLAHSLFPG